MRHDSQPIEHIRLDGGSLESPREYTKLVGVIFGILLVSLFLAWARGWQIERFMSDFMAVFLITFAAFKFLRLEEFEASFSSYDIVAKRFNIWAIIYPFMQGGLGIFYLLLTGSVMLNIITLIVTGLGVIGVWQELKNKSNIMSPCFGRLIRLPQSKVSLVENVTMFGLAAALLVV